MRRPSFGGRGEDDLCWLSARRLVELYRVKALSPVEVASAILGRIESADAEIQAFRTVDASTVLAAARTAETAIRRGDDLGPLHGVPVSVKDLILTQGLATAGGSTAYDGYVPSRDDVVVERVRRAGGIVLGKTNVPAFGYGPGTDDRLLTVTRNPWNLERTAGSSSGGAAAAVAAGFGPIALGSDGGGSIRVPSSFCGVAGMKPSFGLVPLYPSNRDPELVGFSGWESLEHAGPIARDVADLSLLLDILAGPDPHDRHSIPRAEVSYVVDAAPSVAGLRVAWATSLGPGTRADAVVADAVEASATALGELGAEVTPASPNFADWGAAFDAIVAAEADLSTLGALAERPGAVNDRLRAMISRDWTFRAVSDAIRTRKALSVAVSEFFDAYDILLTPTVPVVAYPADVSLPERIGGEPVTDGHCLSWFTAPFNLTGHPAVTVRVGWAPDGLPIGLQVTASHLADKTALGVARAIEAVQTQPGPS